jgi:hypothetical protein
MYKYASLRKEMVLVSLFFLTQQTSEMDLTQKPMPVNIVCRIYETKRVLDGDCFIVRGLRSTYKELTEAQDGPMYSENFGDISFNLLGNFIVVHKNTLLNPARLYPRLTVVHWIQDSRIALDILK